MKYLHGSHGSLMKTFNLILNFLKLKFIIENNNFSYFFPNIIDFILIVLINYYLNNSTLSLFI